MIPFCCDHIFHAFTGNLSGTNYVQEQKTTSLPVTPMMHFWKTLLQCRTGEAVVIMLVCKLDGILYGKYALNM